MEHTLKEVQEICEVLGVRLRFVTNDAPKYLTGENTPSWVAVLASPDTSTVVGLGATMDEAFERAVKRAREVRRFG